MSTFYHSSQSGGGPPGPPGAKGDTGDRGPGVLNWRGDWSVAEAYEPNDAVAFDGSAYICVEAHSGSQPPSAKWNLLASRGSQGIQGDKGDKGDVGDKGDRGERGPQGVPGDQGLQGVPGSRGLPGEKGDTGDRGEPGIVWRGAWDGLTDYVAGEAVQHGGSCYIAVADSTGSEPPSENWGLMAAKGAAGEPGAQGNDGIPGLNWKGEWNDTTTYRRNDVVFLSGSSYVAVAENTSDAPPSDNWNLLAQQGSAGTTITWRGAWAAGTHYETEDAVSRNGSSFLCIQAHFSHEPPNSNYWNVIAQKGDTGVPGPQGPPGSDATDQVQIGWFRCPATLGRYFVELKFPPKSVKFWVSEGSPEAQRYFACCQGMMDDHENQNCMTWAAEENRVVGASRTDLCIYTLSPSGREEVVGGFAGMEHGFSIDFTTVNEKFIIRWEAIG